MQNDILSKIDFLELVSRKVLLIKVKDSSYKGLSPFTNEKTPSFFVNTKAKTWYDFSSGTGGGIMDYVIATEHVDKAGAIAFLADIAGVELEVNDKLSHIRALIKASYTLFLEHASEAVPYMLSRGFSEDVVKRHGIGFAPSGSKTLIEYLEKKNFSREQIMEAGIGYIDTDNRLLSRFQNRVIFPIKDSYGTVVSFTGRRIAEGATAKYLHGVTSPIFRKKEVVWNLSSIRSMIAEQNRVLVCEGQLDALSLTVAGYPAVAILGSSPSDDQIRILAGASQNIYFVFDSDEAGEKALLAAFKVAEDVGIDSVLYAVTLPPGEDPHSFLQGGGDFQELMATARSDSSIIIRALIKQQLLQGGKTRSQVAGSVIKELAPFVKNKLSYRSLDLIERASQEFSLNRTELRLMLERKNAEKLGINSGDVDKIAFPAPIYERRILYAVLDNPALAARYKESGLSFLDFESELISRVMTCINPVLDSAEQFDKLKEELPEDDYFTILEFYSKGLEAVSIDSSIEVMKGIRLKRERDARNNFLGRPTPDNNFTRQKRREVKQKLGIA